MRKVEEETVTPKMKSELLEVIDKANALAGERSELICALSRRLSIAEVVCYTAKGFMDHRNDQLGSVYLDVLQTRVKEWAEVKDDSITVSGWISVKERLPENGQEVLTYYFDESYDIHQISILDYFRAGAVMDELVDYSIESPEKRILDVLFNPNRQVKAPEDGFYVNDEAEETHWRKHADIITHWQPLPTPPVGVKLIEE